MEEKQILIKQRGTIRQRLTLFDKYLKPLMDCKEVNALQLNELRLRCDKVRDLSCNFEEIQSRIELLDEDSSKQIEEREVTENTFYDLIAKAQSLLEFFENKDKQETSSNTSNKGRTCNLKLPPLKIANFHGDPNQWISFRDTYLSLIHENDNIEDVNKFHYLKSYLEGAASSVISSVTVSSNNYQIAWNLLCQRYDNKRLLINEHIKGLFSIAQLHKESEIGIRELIDTLSKNLSALNSLGEPTDKWDTLIIYMASAKLDSVTARNWEEFRSDIDSPTLEQFYSFLRQRAFILETINAGKSVKNEKRSSLTHSKSFIASSVESSPGKKCPFCKQDHRLFECLKFKSLPITERISKISIMKLCSNCLRSGHQPYQCRLTSGCRICHKRHNTLLHRQSSLPTTTVQNNQPNTSTSETSLPDPVVDSAASGPTTSVTMSAITTNQALLSTALVKVTSHDKIFILRALLDSGSQSSFISERAQREIGSCKIKNTHHCVSGIGNSVLNVTEHCTINLHSMHNSFNTQVKCFILPKITERLPHVAVRIESLGIPNNIQLADPSFYQPSEIDLLLGADIFWDLLRAPRLSLGPKRPILQDTHLGWIVAGSMSSEFYNENNSKIHCNFSQDISAQLNRFWELEEIPAITKQNKNDYCETLFNQTTRRESDGRFSVQIPLKGSIDLLGESYSIAEKRFLQLERKLNNRPQLKQQYLEFIHEYERLGHMTEISKPEFGCYLPHHAVIRENSETTKLRVVFDASAKTSNGVSLNDIQYVGPVVQDDLFSILLRYRQHKYVASADVEKMYRQILIDLEQRKLQLILWRDDSSQPIKIFQLNTVTYGTAAAPFLSTRCLLQLSKECDNDDDLSQAIQHDFYVDDFLSGAETECALEHLINSVTAKLDSACLPLRKWRTNSPSILKNKANTDLPKNLDTLSSQSSVLGLKWDPSKDVLQFPVEIEINSNTTKRVILSNSAKLFDPLGLLSPCTIVPKIILQKLWLTKLDWDDSVDSSLEREWLNFTSNLNCISQIEIPRCVVNNYSETIQLHSFSDASQVAYAAAIYILSKNSSGQILVRLLCAKTKVAPIKTISIPRLELCGALLSARLSDKVLKALRCKIDAVFHWTDSTVVLGWLASQSCDLKTFVANRVSEIQELTASGVWRHIPGESNPADLASRGVNPKSIQSSQLWWEGPPFLKQDASQWPTIVNLKNIPELPELKTKKTTTVTLQSNITQKNPISSEILKFERFSKFSTLQRTLAYVLRFINNLKNKQNKTTGALTADELNGSLNILVKQHQNECFSDEIELLKNKENLPAKSRVLSLTPFINSNGIICVGGRLHNSSEPYERKHPILLDSNHQFSKLLFTHYHKKLLHAGPQLLLTSVRENYWPIRGRILARSTVNNCKLCRIMKAQGLNPIMGNLPASRVTPNLPFNISGVDFAGPFHITDRKGRGCKISKCYMCLFVCLSTKALHLEVASDLTTNAFILCLRRFISRRGKPLEIYCDNGTNFVGANNEITTFLKSTSADIAGFASDEGIQFRFSPAYSPHFGGLWEVGVKSAKFHISRILGDKHLTFEELSTLFSQIEAILNSRPLTPLSSDPNDLYPLTPAHFLIGRPLTSLPTESLLDDTPSILDRYRCLEKMRQHFWNRWRNEYLSELQQKYKWQLNQRGLQEQDLVVIKEPNAPPLKWRMARVHKLYPGSDGVSRVADLYTSKGIIRRAIRNLCLLPDPASVPVSSKPRNPDDFEGGQDVNADNTTVTS